MGALQGQADQEEQEEKNTTSCDTAGAASCYPEQGSVATLLPVTDRHGLVPEGRLRPAPGLMLPAVVQTYTTGSKK